MSTRATIHFAYPNGRTEAIAYRHSDGYPEGLGESLLDFLADVQQLSDTRFGDPSYLAAKWIVWDAGRYALGWDAESDVLWTPQTALSFLSVGIVMEDPGDIEWRYIVHCGTKDDKGRPQVEVQKRTGPWSGELNFTTEGYMHEMTNIDS